MASFMYRIYPTEKALDAYFLQTRKTILEIIAMCKKRGDFAVWYVGFIWSNRTYDLTEYWKERQILYLTDNHKIIEPSDEYFNEDWDYCEDEFYEDFDFADYEEFLTTE